VTELRWERIVVTFAAALSICAAWAIAQPSPAVTTGDGARVDTLVYVGDQSAAPWEYLTLDGRPAGFNIDLLREISRISGRPITVRLGPWAQMRQLLDDRQADLAILGASSTRRTRYDFLSFIWTRQQAAIYHAARRTPPPIGLHDLAREVVAIERKSVLQDVLEEVPEERRPALLPVTSPVEALRAVRSGAATLAIGNHLTLTRAVRDLGLSDLESREVKAMAYYLVTPSGRGREFDWLEPVIAALNEDGTMARLVDRHLVDRTSSQRFSPYLLAGGAIVGFALVVGALLWFRRMQRLVAAKAQAEAIAARRREEAEGALRATERQLQQLVHSIKAIVWRQDVASQQYTFVSQEAEQLLGYPVVNWHDEAGFVSAMLHPDDREWVARYSRRATTDRRDHTMEYRVFARDGRLVWLRDIVSVIVEQGEARELIGVMVDISEYKAAEEALEAAHAQALAATRAKSEFLASMSHEIRTPMNAVIGITDLLLDTPLTVEQQQLVETVRTSGDVLLNVINDILDFSKVESGKLEFEHIGLDPEVLADDVARLMSERAAAKGLDLTCQLAPDVPRNLVGDPGRLRQVLLNLVGNAIKFTERGDVSIRVTAPHVTDGQANVRFEVTDTGIGIPSDAQARLFEPFTQADASTTRKFGGTGLGLAISRRIVELLGGNIGVQSEAGHGTTFWFTIPCPRAGTAPAPQELAAATGGLRVLVVDDSQASRVMLEQTLLDAGLTVQVARGSDEAEAAVGEGPWPHVALIDENLAEGAGPRLAEHLRARAPHPLAILYLSSRLTSTASLDAAGRLLKPVRRTELMAALERVGRPASAEPVAAAVVVRPSPQDAAHAARVLVAEDNPVNQKVARLMLERCGCAVDVVENGSLAVDAVRDRAYDLILMDCQMPVCDGLEATRRIRALPDGSSEVVIVALTANALAGDRERCLAAGMNDYLPKPVRRDALMEMLAKYLPGGVQANTAA
jgi:PAS domain S-box-containing protein